MNGVGLKKPGEYPAAWPSETISDPFESAPSAPDNRDSRNDPLTSPAQRLFTTGSPSPPVYLRRINRAILGRKSAPSDVAAACLATRIPYNALR